MLSIIKRKPAWFIVLAAIAVTALLVFTRERSEPLVRPERAWAVDVAPVKQETLRPTLQIFGSAQSPQNAKLSAGIDGLIKEVKVLDGESVTAGQPLVILDERDADLELQQAEADLRELAAKKSFAERRLISSRDSLQKERELLALTETRSRRAEDLLRQKLLSQSDLDTTAENLKRQQLAVNQASLTVEEIEIQLAELSAQAARARALRDQAKLALERTVLSAPFDGVISELSVSQGDRVRIGDQLMRLQNPESIEIRAQVPARHASSISEGLRDGATVPARVEYGDMVAAGKVVRISGQTSEGSGGVDSFIRLNEPPRGLRLGSTVRVLLELPAQNGVVRVPAEALYGRDRLYKLTDNRLQMVEVERVGERILESGATEVLVRSPLLTENDQLVLTKLSNAADGLLVEPLPGAETEVLRAGPVPEAAEPVE